MPSMSQKRPVWTSAVYFQRELVLPPTEPPKILCACRAGLRLPAAPHTKADPFLFEHAGRLFLFVETQRLDDPGRIEVVEITDGTGGELTPVLEEPFHVSYPHVFETRDGIFMLPETADSGELRLYRFDDFPRGLRLVRTLLTQAYTDPSPILVDDTWYLFVTSARGLELFCTDDLINGALCLHPSSPITGDTRYRRSAGVPFRYRGDLVRPAQNESERYGGNVNLLRIDALSRTEYRETPITADLLPVSARWNEQGGHHVNVRALAAGGFAVAIDGQARDSIVNKIVARLWMTLFRGRL